MNVLNNSAFSSIRPENLKNFKDLAIHLSMDLALFLYILNPL